MDGWMDGGNSSQKLEIETRLVMSDTFDSQNIHISVQPLAILSVYFF